MKRYQLDPKNLRQLTPEEEQRLDAASIDYSDIPPLDSSSFTKPTVQWPPKKSTRPRGPRRKQ